MTHVLTDLTICKQCAKPNLAPIGKTNSGPQKIESVFQNQAGGGADGRGAGEFSFTDFLDIINPLQHIPVVSSIYRELTNDQIAAAPRLLGGALFGGPAGIITALGNILVEAETGRDIGGNVIAALTGTGAITRDVHRPNPLPVNPTLSAQMGAASMSENTSAEPITSPTQNQHSPSPIRPIRSIHGSTLHKLIAPSKTPHSIPNARMPSKPAASVELPKDREAIGRWILRNLHRYETMPRD